MRNNWFIETLLSIFFEGLFSELFPFFLLLGLIFLAFILFALSYRKVWMTLASQGFTLI
jgi:hypothetical protein